ncbi:hypothetical protein [Phytomonospora endophytica]|uniref:Uncharacterized protein n=1 Tax=Phytomonospora endophytica TaxID=714109 RepID=A0A841FV76_9ACTN|nr:hypothetical protein [Phytomonospora endophytica]MBB6037442.1 hypothetical protein [Phytomonospora endophytica]GIG70692.1 hypothetical protein Pen01_69870 [Phytomonospora endophytica]
MSPETALERRYRGLLRLYPRHWRRSREDEMTATYLDGTPPGASRPSISDRLDVARGALRTRLRLAGESGLRGGTRLAAELSLIAVAILAALWLLQPAVETTGLAPAEPGPLGFLDEATWITWIAVAVGATVLRARWRRRLTAAALTFTVLLVLGTGYTAWFDVLMGDLAPVLALGGLTLVLGDGRRLAVRLAAPAAALVTAVGQSAVPPENTPQMLGCALASTVLATAVVLSFLHRTEGWWALAVLAGPIALLTHVLPALMLGTDFTTFQLTEVLSALLLVGAITAAVLAFAVLAQNKRAGRRS